MYGNDEYTNAFDTVGGCWRPGAADGASGRVDRLPVDRITRSVCLDTRAMLKEANLRSEPWAQVPQHDATGALHDHLLVGVGRFRNRAGQRR